MLDACVGVYEAVNVDEGEADGGRAIGGGGGKEQVECKGGFRLRWTFGKTGETS